MKSGGSDHGGSALHYDGCAVVLRKINFGDADQIVNLLTPSLGIVVGVARGARKSKRRFGAGLGIGARSMVQMHRRPNAEMWSLQSAALQSGLDAAMGDIGVTVHGAYVAELVYRLLGIEQAEPLVFDLLCDFLHELQHGAASPGRLRLFELQLLDSIGLGPIFDRCASCNCDMVGAAAIGLVLQPAAGGVLCVKCSASVGRARGASAPIDEGVRRYLVGIQTGRVAEAEAEIAVSAREQMLTILHHYVGGSLRSLEFMRKLNDGLRASVTLA